MIKFYTVQVCLKIFTYATGFAKRVPNRTRIEIQFVTRPTKINHVSANYTDSCFC